MSYNLVVKLAIIFLIAGFIAVATKDYIDTKQALAAKREHIMQLSSKIDTQNQAIDNIKINLTYYKNKKPEVVEKVITKYQQIQTKDRTCEAQLAVLQEYTDLFFKRKEKEQLNGRTDDNNK